jgi:hypothetical protein
MTKDKSARVFTLAEVNDLLQQVSTVTGDVISQLDNIRERYQIDPVKGSDSMPEVALKEIEEVLGGWSVAITDLGALPKGYFTVDFQSREPELLYCWTFGEEKIEFAHKVWENFTHRRPLSESLGTPSRHLKWVN